MSNRELIKLVEEYQRHIMKNFNLIYETFHKLIILYANRVGEKESVQDLSSFLAELLFKIDISKFKSDDSEDLQKYIAVCLRNEYYAMLRRKGLQPLLLDDCMFDTFESANTLENTVFVKECLTKVTENHRKILILRYCHDFSDSEISEELHISRQAVNKARNKALETIKKFLCE